MKTLSGGTVYALSIHLVLVTKYRRKVIDAVILQRLQEIFTNTCQKWECTLKEFNGEADHVHMLIDINPKVQISAFVNNLKTISSRFIRQEFPNQCAKYFRKPVFWKIGYFVSSTGGASLETIKRYIQSACIPLKRHKKLVKAQLSHELLRLRRNALAGRFAFTRVHLRPSRREVVGERGFWIDERW